MRFRHSMALLAALALAGAMPLHARTPAPAQPVATAEGISEYRLDNGLRVVLFPDNSKPVTTVNVTYLVGSRHENYGETGMAHLLEHLLFKGTPTQADIPGEMKKRGVGYNATTGLDHTNSFASRGCVLRRASEPLTVTTNYSSRECWWMPTSLASVGD